MKIEDEKDEKETERKKKKNYDEDTKKIRSKDERKLYSGRCLELKKNEEKFKRRKRDEKNSSVKNLLRPNSKLAGKGSIEHYFGLTTAEPPDGGTVRR